MQFSIKQLTRYGLYGFAIFASLLPLFNPFNIFTNLQNYSFDTFQQLFPRKVYEDDPVIIVDIDDHSLELVGQWPWSRTTLARLTDQTYAAAALGFDIVFAEPDRTNPRNLINQFPDNLALKQQVELLPDNDEVFARAIANHGTVVLGVAVNNAEETTEFAKAKFGLVTQGDNPNQFLPTYTGLRSNIQMLEEGAAGLGTMSIGNNDSVVRSLPTFDRVGDTVIPSLGLELARVAIGASTFQIKASNASSEEAFGAQTGINNIKLGPLTMPTTPDGQSWIYFAPTADLVTVSAWDVLSGSINPDFFSGKVVLVGTSAAGLFDLRSTPIEKNIPGVTVIGQFVQQIFANEFLQRPDWLFGAEFIAGLVLSILITFMIQTLGPIGGLTVLGIGSSGIIGGSWYFFKSKLFLVDPISPLVIILTVYIAVTFFNFLFTELERGRVRGAFAQYMSPEMVNRLAESNESLKLGGERKDMTMLFSDIRGFTKISEQYKKDPEALTELINRLLTTLSNEILECEGTIDKYMGDCIMAFWNAPASQENHAELAIQAGVKMRKALKKLNDELVGEGKLAMEIGIGINTGDCIVGNMGSDKRFDYTVLGDAVNLAARLEGQSGSYGVNIVLGEETAKQIPDFKLIELDLLAVKGKTEPVRIYTYLSELHIDQAAKLKEPQNAMLENYREQNWDAAERYLLTAKAKAPELEKYYQYFQERINQFRIHPPKDDWSGVNVATTK
jgi:adenylate cyclase